ncbi:MULTISPECIES: heptaprenyl diphosphate synthase component 1 [unclassified Paenibacillus]|uniref:heptaprenyl diphosphate synthase component 1 n=1 Tax=unclassified Paenibacillus TaxID=185978 RepID=UPI002F411045
MREYRITELAYKYVNYDMIHTYTELPPLSEPRLRLLSAVLNESDHADNSELYALVTSLVQLGMDTHDRIDSSTTGRSELEMRSTQLKVLAGDYFSTRFYQLLAQQGQISMIASLSAAVCDVNRLKIDFYTKRKRNELTTEEYFSYRVKIKSQMFLQYGELLKGTTARLWPQLLLGISRCEAIVEELEDARHPERVTNSWAYWHLQQAASEQEQQLLQKAQPEQIYALLVQHAIVQQLKSRMDDALSEVQTAIRKLESEGLAAELLAITDSLRTKSLLFIPALNETR